MNHFSKQSIVDVDHRSSASVIAPRRQPIARTVSRPGFRLTFWLGAFAAFGCSSNNDASSRGAFADSTTGGSSTDNGSTTSGQTGTGATGGTSTSGGNTTTTSGGTVTTGSVNIGYDGSAVNWDAMREACASAQITLDRIPPTVILLVDQSGSMGGAFSGDAGPSRWTTLHTALMSMPNSPVYQVQDQVVFGLSLFTTPPTNRGGGGRDAGSRDAGVAACPQLTEVAPMLHNYDPIEAVYAPATPSNSTPTAEAIRAVTAELVALPAGPKFILLVTDGLPNACGSSGNISATQQMTYNQASVTATQNAYAEGVGLIVMGVSADIAPQHLQDLANAGAGIGAGGEAGAGNAMYYVASSDSATLAAQLLAAVGTVQNCVFKLNGNVDPDAGAAGTVILGGTPLVYGDPNGWRLNGTSQIEILGTACESIKSGAVTDLSASFPCGAIVVF